jgi:hypothetical protein
MKTKKAAIGAHWEKTHYPPLYQLYMRVEHVAAALEKRRQQGWGATKPIVDELFDIAVKLKVLDGTMKSK